MVFTSTPSEKTELLEKSAIQGRSLWQDALARLLRNRAAVFSMILLAVLVLLAFLGPYLWIHDSGEIYRDRVQIPPTFEHWHIFRHRCAGARLVRAHAGGPAHVLAGRRCGDRSVAGDRRGVGARRPVSWAGAWIRS